MNAEGPPGRTLLLSYQLRVKLDRKQEIKRHRAVPAQDDCKQSRTFHLKKDK